MSPRVDAVLLAAGLGRRMGCPKHLLEIHGAPLLVHVLRALEVSAVTDVCVILRPGDTEGIEKAAAHGAKLAFPAELDEGRAASVRAGVEASDPEAAGLLFVLADQPFLLAQDFDALIRAFREGRAGIVHASYAGQRGSPVLFSSRYRSELLMLRGKDGGRVVLVQHPEDSCAVELDPERGRDLNQREDLESLVRR